MKNKVKKLIFLFLINIFFISNVFSEEIKFEANFIEFPCQLNIRIYGSSKIQFTTTIFNHLSFMKQLLFLRIKSNYKSTI